MIEKGLFFIKGNNDEQKSGDNEQSPNVLFISCPFEILGRVRDPNGEGWARLLRWNDDDKRDHTHAVSDADLHGDVSALCANLSRCGLRIATGRKRNHLVRYLNEVDVENRVTEVPTTGWHETGTAKSSRYLIKPLVRLRAIPSSCMAQTTPHSTAVELLLIGRKVLDRWSLDIHERYLQYQLHSLVPYLGYSA